jgi:hypothetical protein
MLCLIAEYDWQVDPGSRTNQLTPETAAYIAGLIDGEGTITLSRLHTAENRRLVVSIANTEIQLLDFVLAAVGAGKITRKRAVAGHHRLSFCYSITSRQALELLRQVTPHLLSYKRLRAELALSTYLAVTARNGKYTKELRARRQTFERELLAIDVQTTSPPFRPD